MGQSLKQGVERKVTTPTSSYSFKAFPKNPYSISISIYSQAVIPYPGSLRALFFEESNITNILKSYSCIYINYQVNKQEKIGQLSWYCELFTGKYIKSFISFMGTSWATLHKALHKEYKNQDLNQ